jgi:hypothetical protein
LLLVEPWAVTLEWSRPGAEVVTDFKLPESRRKKTDLQEKPAGDEDLSVKKASRRKLSL